VTDRTSIEWTDATWNPLRGCSRVSEGCRNCYAEKIAARYSGVVLSGPRAGQRLPFHGVATAQGWNGKVELVEDKLTEPLSWREPRRVFVNSMSDLFHKDVPDEWIDRVFAVMALAPRHTFQVLTKRPERMRAYLGGLSVLTREGLVAAAMDQTFDLPRGRSFPRSPAVWPLPNVLLGVSVEDQPTADLRIPELLETFAARRFVSYEPALGPVDFRSFLPPSCPGHVRAGHSCTGCEGWSRGATLDWIIVGGESGPGARPFDVAWARSTIRQGREAGVPVFVKQLGARPYDSAPMDDVPGSQIPIDVDNVTDLDVETFAKCIAAAALDVQDRKGGDPAEWPEDLRVREFPLDPSVSPSVSPEIRS
jgi:protein gp37